MENLKKSFGKLKPFTNIVCQDNFLKNAYLDIDKSQKEKKKYIPKLVKFLAKNEKQWIQLNTSNPRIWIDVDKNFSILVNEDWFSEIQK